MVVLLENTCSFNYSHVQVYCRNSNTHDKVQPTVYASFKEILAASVVITVENKILIFAVFKDL